jgi:hypothetical protein
MRVLCRQPSVQHTRPQISFFLSVYPVSFLKSPITQLSPVRSSNNQGGKEKNLTPTTEGAQETATPSVLGGGTLEYLQKFLECIKYYPI